MTLVHLACGTEYPALSGIWAACPVCTCGVESRGAACSVCSYGHGAGGEGATFPIFQYGV